MDKRLVEMLMTMTAGQNKQELLGELVELMDPNSKHKIYEYLQVKMLALLKAQAANIEEAIKRYGAD